MLSRSFLPAAELFGLIKIASVSLQMSFTLLDVVDVVHLVDCVTFSLTEGSFGLFDLVCNHSTA